MSDFVIVNGVLVEYTGSGGNVVIPKGVTEIGPFCFKFQEKITGVTIPESVRSVGRDAFAVCRNLTNVTLSPGITTIAEYAFRDCVSLTRITIPGTVSAIQEGTFSGCTALIQAVLEDGVQEIGTSAFQDCSALMDISIPASISRIHREAFCRCSALERIHTKEVLPPFGYAAFAGCDRLSDENGLVILENRLCHCCSNASEVVVPAGVISLEEFSFGNQKTLTRVQLPEGLKAIRIRAFSQCEGLIGLYLPDSVTELESDAFEFCKMQYLSLPGHLLPKLEWKNCSNANWALVVRHGEKCRFYCYAAKSFRDNFTDFIHPGKWNAYDLELINNGPIYKYKASARLLGALGRLVDPVELTDECKELHLEYLIKNAKKLIPLAESLRCPAIVEAMKEHGIITDKNKKAIAKLLVASQVPEIAGIQL